jgi:hypothetical protein
MGRRERTGKGCKYFCSGRVCMDCVLLHLSKQQKADRANSFYRICPPAFAQEHRKCCALCRLERQSDNVTIAMGLSANLNPSRTGNRRHVPRMTALSQANFVAGLNDKRWSRINTFASWFREDFTRQPPWERHAVLMICPNTSAEASRTRDLHRVSVGSKMLGG